MGEEEGIAPLRLLRRDAWRGGEGDALSSGEVAARPATEAGGGLPIRPGVYAAAAVAATALFATAAVARLGEGTHGWPTFLVLAACATAAQLVAVRTTRDDAYLSSLPFLVAAALLLPPELVALMGAVPHTLAWAVQRGPGRTQAFEACNSTLGGLAAWGAGRLVLGSELGGLPEGPRWALAGLAASLVLIAVRRMLLAGIGHVEYERGPEENGLAFTANLPAELVLAALGVSLAALWHADRWLVPFAVAPMLLVHRSLHVPRLQQQARVDAKTGLFNARHFAACLNDELARARRFGRPVSLVMADFDLLRDINNAHGHLVGDAVLVGIAEVFRSQVRPYDVPARFGGEEFAILLPETDRERAFEIAERIRASVARREFAAGRTGKPIRATISMGVASFPRDATEAVELVHRADLAVYRAKLQGRNRVLLASDDPLDEAGRPARLVALTAADRTPGGSSPRADTRARRFRLPPRPELVKSSVPALSSVGVATLLLGVIAGAPHDVLVFGAAGLLPLLLVRRAQAASAEVAGRRAEKLWRAAEAMHSRTLSVERANRLLRERSAETMETLSAVIDARDSHTAGHSQRVQRLALTIGRELGMSDAELEVLGHAALFHDMGKVAIPDAILLKPAQLDPDEWGVVRRHPGEGARLLERLGFLSDALPAIRHHHERYDGSGYPDHLRGEEIPLGARIIHVADALDAMLTPRVYRPALSPIEALEELRSGAGAQFCPRCVEALDRIMLAELLEGANVPYELLAS